MLDLRRPISPGMQQYLSFVLPMLSSERETSVLRRLLASEPAGSKAECRVARRVISRLLQPEVYAVIIEGDELGPHKCLAVEVYVRGTGERKLASMFECSRHTIRREKARMIAVVQHVVNTMTLDRAFHNLFTNGPQIH